MENDLKLNLVTHPWIPAVNLQGNKQELSLIDVFTEGQNFSDFSVRPHERVALMRLLICIAHASLDGPGDYDDWKKALERLPKTVKLYLEKWKDSFWMFHPDKPFLQVAGLNYDESSPVTKLDFGNATGNNTTLFDHEGNSETIRSTKIEKLAIDLIAYQNFSPGGGLSLTQWEKVKTKQVGNPDAPCVANSMLHSFLRGSNIIQTIWLNLPNYEDVERKYTPFKIGKPVWEFFPENPDDQEKIKNATETYLGRLTPVSRWIKLLSCEEMLCGNGFKYNGFIGGYKEEPSATVVVKKIKNKEERGLLSYQPNRLIWRDLASITLKKKIDSQGGYGPLCMLNINEIDCDLQILAVSRNQATIMDTVDSVYSVSSQIFKDQGRHLYEKMVKTAESIEKKLGVAVITYRRNYDGGWEGRLKSAGASKGELMNKLKLKACIHYWTFLENQRHILMNAVRFIDEPERKEQLVKEWESEVSLASEESYQLACEQETPRGIRAFALGWGVLTGKTKEEKSGEEGE